MSVRPTTADEWLEAVHREFGHESDRAAAIVVAAMLDDALKALLQQRLVPPLKKEHSLVDAYDAPLGTFAARSDAAFQLGLISRYMARDLHLVRKIRNDFAHACLKCTFDSAAVKNRVQALEEGSDYNTRNPEAGRAVGPPGTRYDFLGIAAWMLYSLHRETVEQLVEHGPEFGYVDWSALPPELQEILRREVCNREDR